MELPKDLQTAIVRAGEISTRLALSGREEIVVPVMADGRVTYRVHGRGPILNTVESIDAFEQTLKNTTPIIKGRPSREERRPTKAVTNRRDAR